LTHFPIVESLEENCMIDKDSHSRTFVENVLALLEERFPWLGKENDEQVSGADTVDELADLHRSLIDQHTADHKCWQWMNAATHYSVMLPPETVPGTL
jgi:hypothetical protein